MVHVRLPKGILNIIEMLCYNVLLSLIRDPLQIKQHRTSLIHK